MSRAEHAMNDFNNHEGADEPELNRNHREAAQEVRDNRQAIEKIMQQTFDNAAHQDIMDSLTIQNPDGIKSKTEVLLDRLNSDPISIRTYLDGEKVGEFPYPGPTSFLEDLKKDFRPRPEPPLIFHDEASLLTPEMHQRLYFGAPVRSPPDRYFEGHPDKPPTDMLRVERVNFPKGIRWLTP